LQIVDHRLDAFNLRGVISGSLPLHVTAHIARQSDDSVAGSYRDLLGGNIAVSVDLALHVAGDLRIIARPRATRCHSQRQSCRQSKHVP
jgi:hypothetical protein